MKLFLLFLLFLSCFSTLSFADIPVAEPVDLSQPNIDFPLGPEDQIAIVVSDVEEFDGKPLKIDSAGYIQLPMAGRVKAAGLRTTELQGNIAAKLTKYVQDPQVAVHVVERHSQPVSVLGAVRAPGVQQLQGPKRLMEVLSLAGGLREDAGTVIRIARRQTWGTTGLPGEKADSTGQWYTADIDLNSLIRASSPAANIMVRPDDVITVPVAELIYILGEVRKAGGFTLKSRESMSLLQALSLAEGLQRTAAPKKAKILRVASTKDGAPRQEIPVNIERIIDGKDKDVPMQPEDILVVPNNLPRTVLMRTAETAVQLGTGVLIYRR